MLDNKSMHHSPVTATLDETLATIIIALSATQMPQYVTSFIILHVISVT